EQVAAAVGKHRVDATVIPPRGFLDEHHPLGLEPLGLPGAVVGAKRQHRPTRLAAGGLARPGPLPGARACTAPLRAEVLGVELLGLVVVVDEDAGQPDAHRPRPFLWSLGQLAVLTVLRCYPPGTVAGRTRDSSRSPGSC